MKDLPDMKLVRVKVYPWEKPQTFDSGDFELKKGEIVIVETDLSKEIGEVIETDIKQDSVEITPRSILNKATFSDLTTWQRCNKRKKEALKICREEVRKYKLPMKMVDVQFSFDKSRVTFAFISEQRIDFRELVKNLSKYFQKSVRLQQIGSRDEARQVGGYGHCGRKLCCLGFAGNLESISTQMAKCQQLNHRGSSRLSGPCGRLMCCLAFEAKHYQELYENMPKVGQEIETSKGKGKVNGLLIIEQQVEVELKNKTKVKMALEDIS